MFQTITPWVLQKGLTVNTEIFLPGNEHHGIWASPLLETVYPARSAGGGAAGGEEVKRDRERRSQRGVRGDAASLRQFREFTHPPHSP